MAGRVDVMAYDAYEDRTESEQERRQRIALGTYTVVAVVLGAGLIQGRLLLSVLATLAVLSARWLLFGEDRTVTTTYRAVEAGRGEEIVQAHETEVRKRRQMRAALAVIVIGVVVGWGVIQGSLLLSILVGSVIAGVSYLMDDDPKLPSIVEADVDRERAARQFDVAADE
jgi:hypothetical protein